MRRVRTDVPAKHAARVVCSPQLVVGQGFSCHGSHGALMGDDAGMAGRNALVEQEHIAV